MDAREKLVELIDDALQRKEGTARVVGKRYVNTIADHLIANGVTFAEDNNVPSKWISVKDRLPQDDLPFGALCEIVQVLLDDGTVTVGWCNRGLKCWYYMPIQATN